MRHRPKRPALVASAGMLALLLTGCSDAGAGATAEPTPRPEVETLLDQKGVGPLTTTTFEAKARWDLAYTYDCTAQPSGRGTFQVFVQDVSGRRLNVLVDNEGPQGDKATRWPHGGTYALDVVTPCTWTLAVTG